jgi:hypothetical protein
VAEGEGAAQVFKEVKISFEEFESSFNRYATRLKETENIWRSKMNMWSSMSGQVNQMESSMSKLSKSTTSWAGSLTMVAKNLGTIGGQWNILQRLVHGGSNALIRGGGALAAGGAAGGGGLGGLAVVAGTAAKAFGIAGKAVAILGEAAAAAALVVYKLAQEGAGRGRRAAGFGADVGSMTAAEIYMQRWVNPDAAMANAAQGRYDITSPQYVAMRAGLGMRGSFEGRETGALSEEMVRKAAESMHRGSEGTALSIAHAKGLGSLFSDEELIRLRNSNEKQIQEYIKEAASKKSQYELTKEEIDAENNLITSVKSLEMTFTTQMQHWIDSVIPVMIRVATGLENLIKSIDGWIDWFKGNSGTPAGVVSKIPGANPEDEGNKNTYKYLPKWMTDPLGKVLKDLLFPEAKADTLSVGTSTNPLIVQDKVLTDLLNKQALEAAASISTAGVSGGAGGAERAPASIRARGTGAAHYAGGTADIGNLVETKSIDPEARAFLDTIASTESSGSYSIVNSIGARGRYQFMPGTWAAEAKKLGFDPKNWSHMNQDLAAMDLASTEYRRKTGRDMVADLKAGNIDSVIAHLGPNPWEGLSKHSRESLIDRYKKQLQKETSPDSPAAEPKKDPKKLSLNDLGNFQGAHPKSHIALNINNQAGANVIAQGGILGAGSGNFRVA